MELPTLRADTFSRTDGAFSEPSAIRHTLFSPANGYDTILNNGETWIRPTLHLAASRQQSDDPSGVESSHPEHNGRLQVSPAGRVFINH